MPSELPQRPKFDILPEALFCTTLAPSINLVLEAFQLIKHIYIYRIFSFFYKNKNDCL